MPAQLSYELKRELIDALLPWLDNSPGEIKLALSERTKYRVPWNGVSAWKIGEEICEQATLADWLSLLNEVRGLDASPAVVERFDFLLAEVLKCARSPADLSNDPYSAYHQNRIAIWRNDYQIDTRFVRLSLVQQQMTTADVSGFASGAASAEIFTDLWALVDRSDAKCLMLVGEPGAGKSTLLRRLQYDMARDALNGEKDIPVTFFVPLNEYPLDERDPRDWLAARWDRMYPDLDRFEALVREGRLWLLLDGLNEIKRVDVQDLARRNEQWSDMIPSLIEQGNRVIVTRRQTDEELTWDRAVKVQRAAVRRMNDAEIREFLAAYIRPHADAVWQTLRSDPKLLELYRTPYLLRMLTELPEVQERGEVPPGRAALFTASVRQSLYREVVEKDTSCFRNEAILSSANRTRLRELDRRPWQGFELFDGLLFDGLSELAFQMRRDGRRVSVERQQARLWMAKPNADDLLAAAAELGVIRRPENQEAPSATDAVAFAHELMQEYFAARRLAQPDRISSAPGLAQVAWKAPGWIQRFRDNRQRAAGKRVVEPPLPTTGWEEILPMTAEMCGQPEAFILSVAETNLPLAGKCAAASGVRMSDGFKNQLRTRLLNRMQSDGANLRSRIAAGIALGDIGDSRFETHQGQHGPYMLPKTFILVPAGNYPIGDDKSDQKDEKPAHPVTLDAFEIAKFPVTNAEYRLFIESGGYSDAFDWCWETEAAKGWRSVGRGTGERRASFLKVLREYLHKERIGPSPQNLEVIVRWGYSREDANSVFLKDDEFEAYLTSAIHDEVFTTPQFWEDARFNAPNQPVVGVCWHEARAYCAWLSSQTSWRFRLPTEAERESAARGLSGRAYAYGETFDPTRCVTWVSGIDASVPVGLTPTGDTPSGPGGGISELTGNVWNWTSTLYTDYSDREKDVEAVDSDEPRVLRGGSWNSYQDDARAASRDGFVPDDRSNGLGFRVVRAPV